MPYIMEVSGGVGLPLKDPPGAPRLFLRPSFSEKPELEGERCSRAARSGRLLRLARDVYLDPARWEAAPPWEKYELALAAKAHSTPGAVFCRESALALWRLPLLRTPREVTLRASSRGRVGRVAARRPPQSGEPAGSSRAGLLGFGLRRFATPLSAERLAETTTAPAGALTTVRGPEQGYRVEQLIPVLTDTVPRMGRAAGVAVLDAVLAGERRPGSSGSAVQQAGGLAREVLRSHMELIPVKRHQRAFVEALELADQRSESAGESLLRMVMRDLGFPAPVLQRGILVAGRRYWVDFSFEEAGVVVEFDGLEKYRGRSGTESGGRAAAEAVIVEKAREDAIRSTGRTVVRFVWADLHHAERIGAKLLRAGVPQDVRRRREPAPW